MHTGLFSIAEFRRLWFIGFMSSVERWLEMLAVGLVAYQLTGSAFVVAAMSVLRLLPLAIFGAFIGTAAERFERRSVLIATMTISMLTTLAVAAVASFGAVATWHLAVASFIGGSCWAADTPVRRMRLGDVAGAERMGRAMSYDVGTGNASRVVGPLASGILLAQFGVGGAFWLGSILLLAGLIVTIRLRARREPQHEPLAPFLSSMLEGFAWVRRDVRLIGVLMMTTIFNVFGWSMTTMIPVIGTDYLHLGPRGVGLLASCEGVGGLIGAVLIGVLGRPQWYGRIYVCAVGSYLLLVIAFALAPTPGIAAVLLTLAGMSTVAFAVMQATLVYRDSPPNMRSRLLGVLSVCIGLGPFGFAYLGFLADAATPRIALIAMALQGLLVMALTSRFWIRLVRSETTAAR